MGKLSSFRQSATIAVMTCVFMWVQAAISPALAADQIRQIIIKGTQRIETSTILSYMGLQAGDPVEQTSLDRALKSLFATGLFADIAIDRTGEDIIVTVVENPIINEIRFEGNDEIKSEDLMSEIRLRPRNVLTRSKVKDDVDRLQEVYKVSGRFSANIDPKIIKLDQNRVNLVFEIGEGPETMISRISFIGNRHFDDGRLEREIRSKEDRWWRFWASDDRYDPDRMAYDRELLRRFYMDHGYADFRVENAVAELAPDRKHFYLTFTLEEGERYRVGNIRIESRIAELDASPLKDSLTFKPGDWYKMSAIDSAISKLTDSLQSRQFPFVDVVPDVQRRKEERVVDIVFNLNEGQKLFVENINVNGNTRTLDEVIRREMKISEGDPFNLSQIKESEKDVDDLGFFEKVTAKPTPGSSADKTNIDVIVEEKSTGELSIGAGFSTSDGALADFRIKERNFLGKGQRLEFATTVAAQRTEFDFSFTEPYFMKRDLSAGVDLFHVTRDFQSESSFDSTRVGGALRLGYPLADHWRQNLNYRLETNEITNVQPGASIFIQEQEGKRTTSAVAQSLSYDATDSRQDPTEGFISRFDSDLAGFGGDARYVRLKLGGTYYYPLREKWIGSLLGEVGYTTGWGGESVHIHERFQLGGQNLRGFADGGIGPRDIATGDSLGGNRYWRGSAQVDFPSGLPEELGFKLHVFSDFGTLTGLDDGGAGVVDKASLRASAGGGVSWKSPMGPVTIDFARAIAKEDFDDAQFFRFNFGTRF